MSTALMSLLAALNYSAKMQREFRDFRVKSVTDCYLVF